MIIVLIEAPSSLRVKLPNYVTIDKQDITPENKKKVSEELSITDWLDIRSCDSVHTLVEKFQLMIKFYKFILASIEVHEHAVV